MCTVVQITQHVRGCVSLKLFRSLSKPIWIRRSIAIRVRLLVLLCNTRQHIQLGKFQPQVRPSDKAARLTRSPQSHRTKASRAFTRSMRKKPRRLLVHPHYACKAPTSTKNSSLSPMVAGLRGRRENTHCTEAEHCGIIFIDSLPEACVSLVTFDIILLSMAPRRSTLPICLGASNPAGLIATPFLVKVEPNTSLLCVPRPKRTSLGQPAHRVQSSTKARRHACDNGDPKLSDSFTIHV